MERTTRHAFFFLVLKVLNFSRFASAEGFLRAGARNLNAYSLDFQEAMESVLGCGSGAGSVNRSMIEEAIMPIWQALPKNNDQQVEWRLLRFLAHRYFMQQSSRMIRGFEPTRQVNDSHAGYAEILNKEAPVSADVMLGGSRKQKGFSFEDAVALVTALEQVLFDSESTLLESVYRGNHHDPHEVLSRSELHKIIEDYMIEWMLGEDRESIAVFQRNHSLRHAVFPKWAAISEMVEGTLKSMEFKQHSLPEPGQAHVGLSQEYSFQDAHVAVGTIAKSFAGFWDTECQDIKQSLVAMDKSGTGRVRLSDFYGSNMNGEWRFGESEAYLRELGALDESSPWKGKQVIIPNYMQAASNCIVSTPHYLVCCVNECESILNDVEAGVGSPLAHSGQVLQLLGNVTNFDDEPPALKESLKDQLERIAETHNGKIPLHGRLFAQWLHYVFPRECPFPHKTGTSSAQTPTEFGDNYIASVAEKIRHVQTIHVEESQEHDLHWMSQWSEEEELIADYSVHLYAPWEGGHWLGSTGAVLLIVTLALVGTSHFAGKPTAVGGLATDKCHFV